MQPQRLDGGSVLQLYCTFIASTADKYSRAVPNYLIKVALL